MRKIRGCRIAKTAKVMDFVNLYGCTIGDHAFVRPFVEIQKGAVVGPRTRISSHSFVCEGVTIGENGFIGHGVMFTNDLYDADLPNSGYVQRKTVVGDNVRIGSNATLLPVRVGDHAV